MQNVGFLLTRLIWFWHAAAQMYWIDHCLSESHCLTLRIRGSLMTGDEANLRNILVGCIAIFKINTIRFFTCIYINFAIK